MTCPGVTPDLPSHVSGLPSTTTVSRGFDRTPAVHGRRINPHPGRLHYLRNRTLHTFDSVLDDRKVFGNSRGRR